MSKDDLTTKEQSKKGNKDTNKNTKSKKKMSQFFKELKAEFKKIVWPTKDSLKHNTVVVLTFITMYALFVWTIDWVFINIFSLMF